MEYATSYGGTISVSRPAYDRGVLCLLSDLGTYVYSAYRDFGTTTTSISQDGPLRPLLIEVQSNEDATEQSVPTYHACRLLGPPCGSLLEGSIQSIRSHLRFHGHRHEESAIILCPWQGCTAQLQYMSIPRHIRSTHLGVRFRCEKCGKTLTREEGLAKHVKRCTRSS